LNSNSDRPDQGSDLHDISGGNIGIGNLHLVQESMQENNSSPTNEQRMPRINVDQIDERALDTIVLPSNIQGAQ